MSGARPERRAAAVEVVLHRAAASGAAAQEAALRHTLTTEERGAADAHRTAPDRARAVRSRGLLRAALGERLGVAPADVPLARRACTACGGPHGKPEVAGPCGRAVRFSVGHADGALLVAVTGDGVDIGVDLEVLAHADGLWRQEAAWLHPDERAALAARPRTAELAACLWTRKEAVLKGTGEGLNREPATLAVLRPGDDGPLVVEGWRVVDLAGGPGSAAALAVQAGATAAVDVREASATPVASFA